LDNNQPLPQERHKIIKVLMGGVNEICREEIEQLNSLHIMEHNIQKEGIPLFEHDEEDQKRFSFLIKKAKNKLLRQEMVERRRKEMELKQQGIISLEPHGNGHVDWQDLSEAEARMYLSKERLKNRYLRMIDSLVADQRREDRRRIPEVVYVGDDRRRRR